MLIVSINSKLVQKWMILHVTKTLQDGLQFIQKKKEPGTDFVFSGMKVFADLKIYAKMYMKKSQLATLAQIVEDKVVDSTMMIEQRMIF